MSYIYMASTRVPNKTMPVCWNPKLGSWMGKVLNWVVDSLSDYLGVSWYLFFFPFKDLNLISQAWSLVSKSHSYSPLETIKHYAGSLEGGILFRPPHTTHFHIALYTPPACCWFLEGRSVSYISLYLPRTILDTWGWSLNISQVDMLKKVETWKPKVPSQILVVQDDSWFSSFMLDTIVTPCELSKHCCVFWGGKVGKDSLALKVLFMMW